MNKNAKITLREYKEEDILEVIRMFKTSILGTCLKDYSQEEAEAWISGSMKRN